MGPIRYAGRSSNTGWRFWRHPALRSLGAWSVFVRREGAVLSRETKSGWWLGSWWIPFHCPDAQSQKDAIIAQAEVAMRRREKVTEGIAKTPHADGGEMLEQWPTLAGWLTDPTFDDGSDRKGGWAGISCRDGLWVALMKDDGEGLQITLSAPSPLQLLGLMEHALCSPDAPWRHDPKALGPKSKKK